MTDHRAEADDRTRTERSLEHIGEQLRSVVLELRVGKVPDLLAAIHDEQRLHTGLLADLRGAIDDLAEVLRPAPKWADLFGIDPKFSPGGPTDPSWPAEHSCDCGRALPCRHCPDTPKSAQKPAQEVLGGDSGTQGHWDASRAHSGDSGIRPEPESVTVTLPRDVVEAYTSDLWRQTAFDLRHSGERKAADVLDALADALDAATTPPAPPAAHESDDQPTEAPADGEGAERPTAANLDEIRETVAQTLHGFTHGGWTSGRGGTYGGTPWGTGREQDRRDDYLAQADVILAALAPHMLGEGQVAVDMRPGWRGSTPADWRKEAEILRKERPDALAAAALCEQFADALDGGQS